MRSQDAAFHLFLYRTHTKALAHTPSFMLLYGFIPTSTEGEKRRIKNCIAYSIDPIIIKSVLKCVLYKNFTSRE